MTLMRQVVIKFKYGLYINVKFPNFDNCTMLLKEVWPFSSEIYDYIGVKDCDVFNLFSHGPEKTM